MVAMLNNIQEDFLLEQMIYEKVFHYVRPLQYNYICGVCGHEHRSKKSTDDYQSCERCKSRAVHSTQCHLGWKRPYPTGASNLDMLAHQVIAKMRSNYSIYFGAIRHDQEVVSFSLCRSGFSAKFLGGEEASDTGMAKTMCRASVLVPFLWDSGFCWKNNRRKPSYKQSAIMPTLFQWLFPTE
jgi:DNA-directed RNA polymerase subunit RPC12/RpoP